MIYNEEHRDLFSVDFKKWTPAHCISRDCKMGAGIALPMKKKFHLGGLKKVIDDLPIPINIGISIYHNGVYNLITKKKYFHKPTYDSITKALVSMFYHSIDNGIFKIVMPKIGSGLDRLSWPKVKEIIIDVFKDSNVEILICVQ